MDVGGTELNAVRTAERLDRERFDLSVVCFRDEGLLKARYEAAGIPVLTLGLRSLHDAHAVRSGLRFRRLLRAERVDIVHSHDMYSNPFVTPWARAAGTPVAIASRRWWQTLPSVKLRLANAVAFRMAHCVLANSPAVADSVQRVERIPRRRVAVVSNFVDDGAFAPLDPASAAALRAEWSLDDELVVGCVARLVPVKNQALLLEAVARLRQNGMRLRAVFVGGGPTRAALEMRARDLGIETVVHFTGERTDPINFHQLFDVSILCSQSEGFPNAIVEAMAAGRPVVATRIGGNVDAVRDGETGFLVPVGDAAALAAAIERLARDPALRARQGAAAQAIARAEYHRAAVIPSLEALYERLLGEARQ
jgi:glycosyltransferase involved in cell wall biosynthesis